tara:strand:- start:30 stop:380 length:351 start_codon:yes stop_codon:yes gene_type:complete
MANWEKYADDKAKSLGGFEKKEEIIKEAVAEVPEEKDEFDVVIKEAIPAIPEEKREWVVYKKKQWDSSTGEALADSEQEYSLEQLESEKAGHDKAMADAKAKSDAMVDVIADFKKL